MEANTDSLTFEWRYKLLTGLVVPRPITVVSSLSPNGIANVAPFSYLSISVHDPMALSFTDTGAKPGRNCKDTLRNVRPIAEGGTAEFVIKIAVETYASALAKSPAALPANQSEFQVASLNSVPSRVVQVPRVGEVPACFECRTLPIVPIGRLADVEYCRTTDRFDLPDEGFSPASRSTN